MIRFKTVYHCVLCGYETEQMLELNTHVHNVHPGAAFVEYTKRRWVAMGFNTPPHPAPHPDAQPTVPPSSVILNQITSVQADNTRLVLENRKLKADAAALAAWFEQHDSQRFGYEADMRAIAKRIREGK